MSLIEVYRSEIFCQLSAKARLPLQRFPHPFLHPDTDKSSGPLSDHQGHVIAEKDEAIIMKAKFTGLCQSLNI